jgi:hypothetical protein
MKEKLKDTQLKAAKATDKPLRLNDGDGLYLIINPNQNKLWRFRYHFNGKENTLSLGKYPHISLKDARDC